MRGGTSRGVFFHAGDLPTDLEQRDRVLMNVIGASDPRQVDGLGGADLLLSKVALVWPSDRADADVECCFGSIPPGSKGVKFGANCGNLASAAACFARQEGLVDDSRDLVRLYNPDSGSRMEARLRPREAGRDVAARSCDGMPTTGELVELSFLDPTGTAGDGLLPTRHVIDELQLPDGRRVAASIVDAGAQYVFLRAEELNFPAAPSQEIEQRAEILAACEYLRGQAAVLTGLADSAAEAARVTPAVPKLAFVGPAVDYCTAAREQAVSVHHIDLVGRIVSSQSFHQAYAVTGAIATAAAALVPGSVVHRFVGDDPQATARHLRIGHPTGTIECTVEAVRFAGQIAIRRASFLRTARRIMAGRCFLE